VGERLLFLLLLYLSSFYRVTKLPPEQVGVHKLKYRLFPLLSGLGFTADIPISLRFAWRDGLPGIMVRFFCDAIPVFRYIMRPADGDPPP